MEMVAIEVKETVILQKLSFFTYFSKLISFQMSFLLFSSTFRLKSFNFLKLFFVAVFDKKQIPNLPRLFLGR